MARLTAQQLRDKKRELQENVRSLMDFRRRNEDTMTDEEFDEISERIRVTLNDSARMTLQAINGTKREITDSVKKIKQATENANLVLETLSNVRKGIRIAASIAGLAASLAAGNPAAIINNAVNTLNLILSE